MTPSLLPSVQQYQVTYEQAIEMFNLFEDAEPSVLLEMQVKLASEAEKLLRLSELDWAQCGNLGRHLTFLTHYLKKDDKASCAQDIKDILFFDLPTTLRSLIAKASDNSHFDQRLRDGVMPLVDGGHYDSAVRKVFVLLTDRLRRAFGVQDEIDGEDLINLVFGRGGKIPVALDEPKRQAFRNLISGFYGVFRNRFAHNDAHPDLAQTAAILEMANTIISELEIISAASARVA